MYKELGMQKPTLEKFARGANYGSLGIPIPWNILSVFHLMLLFLVIMLKLFKLVDTGIDLKEGLSCICCFQYSFDTGSGTLGSMNTRTFGFRKHGFVRQFTEIEMMYIVIWVVSKLS